MKNNILNIAIACLVVLGSVSAFAQEKIISLETFKSQTLEHNKRLKKDTENIEAAKSAKLASDATNKPKLDASATGAYLGKPINTLLPEYLGSATLGLTQVLYAGNKINTGKKMNSLLVEVQESQKKLTEDEVLLNVENAYWQLVNANEKVSLAKQYIEMLNVLYTDLNNKFVAGLIYKNDVLKVQVQQNEADLNLIKANDAVTLLKLNLAQLSGRKDTDFQVQKELDDSDFITLDQTVGSADARPEIEMLSKSVALQELQTKLKKGDQLPTVALSANGLYAIGKNINFSNGDNNMTSFYGLVNVSIPIFDWGERKNKVREQQHKTDANKWQLEETREQIDLEIRSLKLQLDQSVEQIEITKKSLLQADENLRLFNDRLKAGTVVGKDVLEAQILWKQAFSDVVDAKAIYKINEAKYKKATGTL